MLLYTVRPSPSRRRANLITNDSYTRPAPRPPHPRLPATAANPGITWTHTVRGVRAVLIYERSQTDRISPHHLTRIRPTAAAAVVLPIIHQHICPGRWHFDGGGEYRWHSHLANASEAVRAMASKLFWPLPVQQSRLPAWSFHFPITVVQ